MKLLVRKPLIIAHRGASALAPENTFAAFERAIDDQADGIEFDVRLAKDGVPVVFHDSTLNRLGKIDGCVSAFTSEELQKLDVGSWFNDKNSRYFDKKFSAETIPTLWELFDFLVDYKGLIYVELKGKEAEIPPLAEAVCDLIGQTNLLPQIIIKSFKLEGVAIAKQILPEIRTAALFSPKILTLLGKKKRILKKAQACNADEISIHYSLATEKFVRRAEKKGFLVTIWTADNPVWVRRAFNLGINAIITNNPSRLSTIRDEILRKI
ncbi:MAG: hypothetical protein M3388_10715 [Acidobacteriota bacterium]|nr:hypothetical protein [Acidobacteriota bacterium]